MATPPVPLAGEDSSGFEGMIAGRPYTYGDPYIQRVAKASLAKLAALQAETDPERQQALIHDYFHCTRPTNRVHLLPQLFCEYGFNVTVGDDVVIGHGCKFLDVAPITIGDRTMLGPSVQIFTPVHPLLPEARNGTKGKEAAKAITIGADCWIGGGAIILPGVTLGDGVTIGAGSVVTRDIPARSVAVGNPARVVKTMPEATEQDIAPWRV